MEKTVKKVKRIIVEHNGWLSVGKNDNMFSLCCPFQNSEEIAPRCGYWCPLLGEPVNDIMSDSYKWEIGTCFSDIWAEKLIDER